MTARRYASVICLKPEREAEYRELHADVWPSVQRRLTESHIGNYSIYLRDGYLFAYFEYTGNDFDGDMAAMRDDPETRRWWTFTDPCQQPVDTAEPGEWWAPMDELFHLD